MSMFERGSAYCIRTVTQVFIGRLTHIQGDWFVLCDASWVADTGPWSSALATGKLRDVQPYPDGKVFLNAEAIVDVCEWKHALPRETR